MGEDERGQWREGWRGQGVEVRRVVQVTLTALAGRLEGAPAARVVEKEAGL